MKWRSLDESSGIDLRPLREQFSERKTLIEKYVTSEVRDIHARAIVEIRNAVKPIEKGALAPSFTLPDQNGRIVSSAELLNAMPGVICFFRGRWCPFCVGQLEAMNAMLPQIEEAGAALLAISPQTVQQSFFMADQHRLQFPLLSDSNNTVAEQFGLSYVIPEYEQSIYRHALVNLPFINGDDSWTLPVPATFLIDAGGTIRKSWIDADYTARPEPSEVVEFIRAL